MLPGLEGIPSYIDIDGDEISRDEEPIFRACERKGLDVEQLVFTQTGVIHPLLKYLTEDLRKDPSLERMTSQDQAVNEIRAIYSNGVYSRREWEIGTNMVSPQQAMKSVLFKIMAGSKGGQGEESGLPPFMVGDLEPFEYKGLLLEVVESHGGSLNDYVLGNIGRGSMDGSLENLESAVVVAFHRNRLELIDDATFRILLPRREAVAAIIGLYLSKLTR